LCQPKKYMSDQAVLLPKWFSHGDSFWQKNSFITHMLFELRLFRNLAQSTFFRDTLSLYFKWGQGWPVQPWSHLNFTIITSMIDIDMLKCMYIIWRRKFLHLPTGQIDSQKGHPLLSAPTSCSCTPFS
jgi:hypothetical protein